MTVSKVALITDTHFGVKNGNPSILAKQESFFKDVFFPRLDADGIKVILDLGDTFDKRKSIDFFSLSKVRKFFFDEIASRGIEYHAIVGNHSTLYKNTNSVNSLELLLQEYPGMHFYVDDPVKLEFGSTKFLMVPWLTRENTERSLSVLDSTDADIICGHFEITGFEMLKGTLCTHGLSPSIFKRFHATYSGHFHEQSQQGSIRYLGAPYEMTWSDYSGNRGFHIIDTETRELEFIQNQHRVFVKLSFDGKKGETLDPNLKDAFIKLEVSEKTSESALRSYQSEVEALGVSEVRVIEKKTLSESEVSAVSLDLSNISNTQDVINQYVDRISEEKPELQRISTQVKTLLTEIHHEALAIL